MLDGEVVPYDEIAGSPAVLEDVAAVTDQSEKLAEHGGAVVIVEPHDTASATAPTTRQAFGVGPDTAAETLVIFGDNPERVRSDAAFAKRCGACPVPASSGMTSGRHRLYTGGHRQANAALYRKSIHLFDPPGPGNPRYLIRQGTPFRQRLPVPTSTRSRI